MEGNMLGKRSMKAVQVMLLEFWEKIILEVKRIILYSQNKH